MSGPPIGEQEPGPGTGTGRAVLIVPDRRRRWPSAALAVPLTLIIIGSAVLGYRAGRSDWRGLSWPHPERRPTAPLPAAVPKARAKADLAEAHATRPPAAAEPAAESTRRALDEIQKEAEAKKAERRELERLKEDAARELARVPRRPPAPNPRALPEAERRLRLMLEAQQQQLDQMMGRQLAQQHQFAEHFRNQMDRQFRQFGGAFPGGFTLPPRSLNPRARNRRSRTGRTPNPNVREFVERKDGPGYHFESRTVIITNSRDLFPGR